MRESRPRSKRLQGLGTGVSRTSSPTKSWAFAMKAALFDSMFELVGIGTDEDPHLIHAKLPLYSDGEITAGGIGSGGSEGATTLGALLNVTSSADVVQNTDKILVRRASASGENSWTLANLSDISGTVVGIRINGEVKQPGTDKVVDLGTGWATETYVIGNYLASSLRGAANGLAELGSDGKVPSSQLPSYVDDVLEFASVTTFPATGESGKIYIAKDTNKTYRWSGTGYVEISASLALGETSSTAYRGDRGKIAYDHTFQTDNPHSVTWAQVKPQGGIGTSDIADSAITNAKIAAGTIGTDRLNTTVNEALSKASSAYQKPPTGIPTKDIEDGAITSGKIATKAVLTEKINDYAVTSDKLADSAVTEGKIASGAVTTAKIGDSAITTAKIGDEQVTLAKLEQAVQDILNYFTLEGEGTAASPYYLHTIYNLCSDKEITAGGVGSGGGSSSGIVALYARTPSGTSRLDDTETKQAFIGFKVNNGNLITPDGNGVFNITTETVITSFNNLTDRPKYNGTVMTSSTDIPEVKTSVWDAKQNSLGTGTNGQILSWSNGAPAWIAAPATGVTSLGGKTGAIATGTGIEVTSANTLTITSTYQTYINNGNTAYGYFSNGKLPYSSVSGTPDLSDMATRTWVNQQSFAPSSALNGYLPLTGGTLSDNLRIRTENPNFYLCDDEGTLAWFEARRDNWLQWAILRAGGTGIGLHEDNRLVFVDEYAAYTIYHSNNLTKSTLGLGNVENTALSTWAGTGYITTLGTITTGVWHGTAIAKDYLASGVQTSLGKADTAYSWGDWRTRVGTLEGYFTNGSANNALQLTNPHTLWGRSFNGTQDVNGDMESVGKMTFTPKSSKSESGNVLEVVTIDGVPYLHTTLPFFSDNEITAGGVGSSSGSSGGIVALYAKTSGNDVRLDNTETKQAKFGISVNGSLVAPTNGVFNISTSEGSVTMVNTGTGLTGGPITGTGTIGIDSTYQTYISHGESAYNSLGNYVKKESSVSNYSVWADSDWGFSSWYPNLQGIPAEYGVSLNFRSIDPWYYRLMFGTDSRIYFYNGINTTTLTYRGTLAYLYDIPTNNNQLTNGAGYITSSALSNYQPLATAINTGNIASQSVAYATNVDTVDNEHASAFAHRGTSNNLIFNRDEFTFVPSGFSGPVYINYRTDGGTNGNITDYYFCNGGGTILATLGDLKTQSAEGHTAYGWGNHAAAGYCTLNTYQTISGRKYFTDVNYLKAQDDIESNRVPEIDSIAAHPFGNKMWHDHLAFLRVHTIVSKQVYNGSTWENSTRDISGLFIQKETDSIEVVAEGEEGFRFVLQSDKFKYSELRYLRVARAWDSYVGPFSVTAELSMDGSNWTVVHQSTMPTTTTTYFCRMTAPSEETYLRISFVKSGTGTQRLLLASLAGLASRKGNQGLGIEYELPFNWDLDASIYPFKTQELGRSGDRWSKIYGVDGYFDRVGIGTTNPSYKLDVNGAFRASGNSSVGGTLDVGSIISTNSYIVAAGSIKTHADSGGNAQYIYAGAGATAILWIASSGSGCWQFSMRGDNEDNDFRIYNAQTWNAVVNLARTSGNVGIGTTSPSEKLHVIGNIVATGDVAAGSDERWKHNIIPVTNGIDAIMKLQPSEWEWNSDNHRGSGFVAQQVQSVLPHLVKTDNDGYLHLTYDGLHAYEISAIQSHEQRIAALERENAELRRQLSNL